MGRPSSNSFWKDPVDICAGIKLDGGPCSRSVYIDGYCFAHHPERMRLKEEIRLRECLKAEEVKLKKEAEAKAVEAQLAMSIQLREDAKETKKSREEAVRLRAIRFPRKCPRGHLLTRLSGKPSVNCRSQDGVAHCIRCEEFLPNRCFNCLALPPLWDILANRMAEEEWLSGD